MDENKAVLVALLGEKDGASLYGKAVNLSVRTGIALEDVVQELAIASQKIIVGQGKYLESYVVNEAKHALYGENYGVNAYYFHKGVSEEYIVDTDDSENFFGESISDDLSEAFETAYATLTPDQQRVLNALAGGWQAQEIAQALGKSNAWVSSQKAALKVAFGYAVAEA